MKHSERNLTVIRNFLLHLTHCENNDKTAITPDGIPLWKYQLVLTPEMLYRIADEYIEEDHVDGKDNPEDEIIPTTYWTESSWLHQDIDKEFPELLDVNINHGHDGSCQFQSFDIQLKREIEQLITYINNPQL